MPRLSLIIPIYNVEDYLTKCLESVLEQDSSTLEVIMVNDHSTDNSGIIANSFVKKFKDAKLIEHDVNCGLGPARNTALSAAKGAYIMMLDSDDWLESNAIHTVLTSIKQSNFDIAQFGCNKIYQHKEELNLYLNNNNQDTLLRKQLYLLTIPMYAWLKIYKKSFIIDNKLVFNNMLYEDIPWSINAVLAATKIDFFPYVIYNYRQRIGSITNTVSSRHLDLLYGYQNIYHSLIEKPISPRLKRALDNNFIESSYYLHAKKEKRLHKTDIEIFWSLFFNITKKNGILPTSFRAVYMLSIMLTNRVIGKNITSN